MPETQNTQDFFTFTTIKKSANPQGCAVAFHKGNPIHIHFFITKIPCQTKTTILPVSSHPKCGGVLFCQLSLTPKLPLTNNNVSPTHPCRRRNGLQLNSTTCRNP